MDTLVLTTLLLAAIGLIAIVLDLTVGTFLPNRHKTPRWILTDDLSIRSR
jgi:hypothetical protein